MLSNETISILKDAAAKLASAKLTAEEKQKVERLAEELRMILDAARLRAF